MAKAKKLKSGNWRVLVYSHTDIVDGKSIRRYKSFTHPNKKQAELMAAEYAANNRKMLNRLNMTVAEATDKYISSKENVLSPSTIRGYRRMARVNFQPISNLNIYDLTQEQAQRYINDCSASFSPKTVANIHGLLSAVLGMFRPDFRLSTTLPQKVQNNIYVPSDSEIAYLLSNIENTELEKAVLLAAFGSMRRSEIAALTAEDIQSTNISVNKALVQNEKDEWIIKAPKTFSSYRTIELPQIVINKFAGICGNLVKLTPDQITSQFSDALKKYGLPHFRFHDLRHYQASILHALGVPDLYIMRRGGWKSANTLNKIYKHEIDAKRKEVIEMANHHFIQVMQHEMQHKK